MDDQTKNLILATALSFLVIVVWSFFFAPPPVERDVTPAAQSQGTNGELAAAPPIEGGSAAVPTLDGQPIENRDTALAKTERVTIESNRVIGSLSLEGGRIDDLKLKDYKVTLDAESDIVTVLSPIGTQEPYYALYGWAPAGDLGFEAVPGAKTPWSLESGTILSPSSPITLVWDNGAGLVFRRNISMDEDFLFSITQSVQNNTNAEIAMAPYGIIARHGEPETIGFYILHEGVVRFSDTELGEVDYDDMTDIEPDPREQASIDPIDVQENGWIGFTGKEWMTTLLPASGQAFKSVAKYSQRNDTYQTDMRLPRMTVAAGATSEMTTSLFAGAKEWEVLKKYEDEQNFANFTNSIDWGWFQFLTKPLFQLLHWLNVMIGNMGWSILALTVIVKAILFPLAYKSYVSMAKMKELQPEMEKIKERTGDDRQKLQQEMMALYKKEKVNPASGCLPILVQIPIFFSLYKVLFVTIEMRHAPFMGWIKDLSAPDPTSWMNLFGLLPYAVPAPGVGILGLFSIGVFPILMGVTMWMQQKLNPAPTDKTQAQIFAWMPWIFMFMLGTFASGLVIYWCANNIITFAQQYTIMRSQGVKPDVFGNILASFKQDKAKE